MHNRSGGRHAWVGKQPTRRQVSINQAEQSRERATTARVEAVLSLALKLTLLVLADLTERCQLVRRELAVQPLVEGRAGLPGVRLSKRQKL